MLLRRAGPPHTAACPDWRYGMLSALVPRMDRFFALSVVLQDRLKSRVDARGIVSVHHNLVAFHRSTCSLSSIQPVSDGTNHSSRLFSPCIVVGVSREDYMTAFSWCLLLSWQSPLFNLLVSFTTPYLASFPLPFFELQSKQIYD